MKIQTRVDSAILDEIDIGALSTSHGAEIDGSSCIKASLSHMDSTLATAFAFPCMCRMSDENWSGAKMTVPKFSIDLELLQTPWKQRISIRNWGGHSLFEKEKQRSNKYTTLPRSSKRHSRASLLQEAEKGKATNPHFRGAQLILFWLHHGMSPSFVTEQDVNRLGDISLARKFSPVSASRRGADKRDHSRKWVGAGPNTRSNFAEPLRCGGPSTFPPGLREGSGRARKPVRAPPPQRGSGSRRELQQDTFVIVLGNFLETLSRMKKLRAKQIDLSGKEEFKDFRNVALVPMETSSSDTSSDSFASDNFTNSKAKFRTEILTDELARIFNEDSDENETFNGFSESDLKDVMEAMSVKSESEEEMSEEDFKKSPRTRSKRSFPLRVAFRFPSRKNKSVSMPVSNVALSNELTSESDSELDEPRGSSFLEKRALNIKENKAMLAKLIAELKTVPGLIPRRVSVQRTPSQPKRPPRNSFMENVSRQNPESSARPRTRSRSLVDGPPSPSFELEDNVSFMTKRKFRDNDFSEPDVPLRRRSRPSILAIPHVVRPVEDVSQEELENISLSAKEKIYNSTSGTTCHQCRQKTIDTKTNCRNLECIGVRGQFCGPCLRNRYGELVRNALLDPNWHCPPCRGICNCSFCRQREGRCATGVLVYLAKYHGYDNVHAYLKRNKMAREGILNFMKEVLRGMQQAQQNTKLKQRQINL
ncbi:cell division cycle-associated protein 7-like [Narcine bancroftii]|uniref:cell division cycle-associated protein 7-like n=1 Tax=Narcine bancroftii TaxID=1343680 RepID=UPI003831A57C